MQRLTTPTANSSTPVFSAETSSYWEQRLGEYLDQLAQVQEDILQLLAEKRRFMMARDLEGLQGLQGRQQQLCARLEQLQAQRQEMLDAARREGHAVANLETLASAVESARRAKLRRQVQELAGRLRLTQHAALTNWVLAQRSLLHVMQMLEILATGGRLVPTYGAERSVPWGSGLIDQEA